jgi:predicted  nucleic acid-binding Zn-ribbon protein
VTRVSNLFRLQTLDSQIDSHASRLAEIESNLQEHPELDRARAGEDAARVTLEASGKDARRAEEETRRQQQRIDETEKTLYGGGVRNPKELQDLQNEAASQRRYLAVLEERQLQAMLGLEEAEKSVSAAEETRREQERLRSQEEARLREGQAAEQTALATLSAQREAALSAVTAEDLEQYNALRRTKRGVAVVRLESGACSGCGVTAASARIDSARSGQEIVQCSNCGRILYLG